MSEVGIGARGEGGLTSIHPSPHGPHHSVSRRPRLGGDAGDLAEAVEALAEDGGQLVEPLRLDGVFHLVIVTSPPKSAFDDGHREWPAPGPDDGLERLAFALRDDAA